MALTLEQYADYLDKQDLVWPAPPPLQKPKAKPHLAPLPAIRAVTWSTYGTLLHVAGGQLLFEHPQKFVMEVALDKTQQEFKMWSSMTRKPGQPSDQLGSMYAKVLSDLRMVASPGEKCPEVLAEKVWEGIIKKLLQKDYKLDAGFYGSLNEFSRKVAYFFHSSLQGVACYPEAARALEHVKSLRLQQGLIGDAQCFTLLQLQRGLKQQECLTPVAVLIDPQLCGLSFELNSRKPSEKSFRHVLNALQQKGIQPAQVLHIGSRITHDVAPARKLGMRTGLFAGDKDSLEASAEQLKDPSCRPDVLLTELSQIEQVVGAG